MLGIKRASDRNSDIDMYRPVKKVLFRQAVVSASRTRLHSHMELCLSVMLSLTLSRGVGVSSSGPGPSSKQAKLERQGRVDDIC